MKNYLLILSATILAFSAYLNTSVLWFKIVLIISYASGLFFSIRTIYKKKNENENEK
jgi:hypothetical protein